MTEQTESSPVLAAQNLTRKFGQFTAVDDVSLAVVPGEVLGLLGANGAGKTTLIRMLLGLLAPSAGRALLMGQEPGREVRRELGYVPQSMGLYPDLTVLQNLEFSASAYDVLVARLPERLLPYQDRLVEELSLGLQRQLAFVVALQHNPRALVMDEPTSGVGPLSRARLWDTVREQADLGTGVLVTTHYLSEAVECDRLLLMSGGRLVAQGSQADLVGDTRALEIKTETWEDAFAALSAADQMVTLEGTGVRVADADADLVRKILDQAQVAAAVREVPATIEERMAALAKGT